MDGENAENVWNIFRPYTKNEPQGVRFNHFAAKAAPTLKAFYL